MSSADIPERVFRFIAEKIDTVPQLEALLLLWESGAKDWPIEEIAARIYVTPEVGDAVLQALQRRQLVRAEGTPAVYRYDGAWDPGGELMQEVAAAYRRHVVRLATFIHSGPSSSVREFARAFDLKKDR